MNQVPDRPIRWVPRTTHTPFSIPIPNILCQTSRMRNFLIPLFLFGALGQLASVVAHAQTEVYGPVTHVRDGDTIKLGPIAVRLEGVSAPELTEKLGQQSKVFMRDLVIGKIVLCRLSGSKTYDRFVGVCFLDGRDIGASIIAKGLARDCPRYSGGRYKNFQTGSAKLMIKLPKYCHRKTYR